MILLIPPSYFGEAFIEYGVRGAPELPLEDGWRVATIPSSGWLKTSSRFVGGWQLPGRLYFWDGKTRTPVNTIVPGYTTLGGANGSWNCPGFSSSINSQIEKFFLGTDYQWKASSYNYWASVICPNHSYERSGTSKFIIPKLVP
jgi:hypothetical protein